MSLSINKTTPIRVLVCKIGLDGHDRGAKVIATALRDAGMEVIYTGLRQTAETVVHTAVQEDVDVIGISILSGAHLTVFPKVLHQLKEQKLSDVLLIGGGIIPDGDREKLLSMGVTALFTPGASSVDIIEFIQQQVAQKREATPSIFREKDGL